MNNTKIANKALGTLIDDLMNSSISEIVGTDFTHEIPAANIIENKDNYVIQLAAPGLEKEDFKITLDKNNLTINVDRTNEKEQKSNEIKRREYNYMKFVRNFRIPEHVDRSSISATYINGLLEIAIEKSENIKEKEITINIG